MKLLLKFSVIILIFFNNYELKFSSASPTPIIERQEISNDAGGGGGSNAGQGDTISLFRESYGRRMKSYMNTSVNPCDDFYAYACGNYPNVIEQIELTRKQNSLYDLTHSMDKIIDKILQKERQPNEEYYEELQKAKRYVEICDSADIFPLTPSKEYLEIIKSIGGFPAVDKTWNASTFDWFNMTAHLLRYGVVGLVQEEIFMRYPFPPMYEIGKFGFGFDVYSDNIGTNDSLGYVHNVEMMKRLLEIYGVVGSKAEKVIDEVIEFWKEALIFQNKAKDGCSEFEEDESEKKKFEQWDSLFDISWNRTGSSTFEYSPCPCDFYFIELNEMSKKKPEAFANYMALKFLFKMHPQINSAKYQHQHCVTQVRQALPMVLTHFYIKEHFSKEVHQEVEEMIAELVRSFIDLVQSNDWLDETTRFGLLDTLMNLNASIGQIVDPITDVYVTETKKLNLTNNYDLNNLELSKFQVDLNHFAYLNYDNINSTVPLEVLKAIAVNAFYDNTEHQINVLAGILFPPIYHRDLPKSMKYGGLGFILGHEIVHSLDPRGRSAEKHFKEIHAWSVKSRKSMKHNSQCFIEHHSNFTVPELNIKLDGKESLTETVCDSGGLRGALNAFRSVTKKALKNHEKDFENTESMPGLNLSLDQTFFVNFAQIYCAKYEPRHYWSELYAGYPMDKYRVTLPLQNFDEFSKVFGCPSDSPMNPQKKCRMW